MKIDNALRAQLKTIANAYIAKKIGEITNQCNKAVAEAEKISKYVLGVDEKIGEITNQCNKAVAIADAHIDEKIGEITNQCNRAVAEAEKISKYVLGVEKRIARFEPHAVEFLLDQNREFAREIHGRMEMLLLRMCVATEVPRPHEESTGYRAKIIKAFDFTDDWWRKRKSLTILEWREIFDSNDYEEVRQVSDDESDDF